MDRQSVPANVTAPPQGTGGQRPFPLLRYYVATSLIVITVITLAVAVLFVGRAEDEFAARSTGQSVTEAAHLAHMFYHRLWVPRQREGLHLTLREAVSGMELEEFYEQNAYGLNVTTFNVLRLDGSVLWTNIPSTGDRGIDLGSFAKVVLQGTPQSELSKDQTVVNANGETLRLDVVTTYYPLRDVPLDAPREGTVLGVLEMTQDVTEALAGARQDTLVVAVLGSIATGTILFTLLFLFVFRADRNIAKGHRALLEQQSALTESESRFRSLVEHAGDAFFLVDAEGGIVDVNQAACDSLGYSREELVRLSAAEIDDGFDAVRIAELTEKVPGSQMTLNGTHRRKDGATFPVEVRVGPMELGGRPHLVSLARDISERRLAEDALRQSEERLRTVFEFAPIGMAIVDAQGWVVRSNRHFQQMVGYGAVELKKMSFSRFTHPDDLPGNLNLFHEMLAGRLNEYSYQKRYIRKDGGTVWGHMTASRLPKADGDEFRGVAMVEDITQRRKAETALMDAKRLAAIGEFAAGMAHEINNPLTAIMRFAHLVNMRDLPGDVKSDVDNIYSEAVRASAIVQSLLSFARKREPHLRPQSVAWVLEKALALKQDHNGASGVAMTQEWPPDLPAAMLDEDQILEVLLNILTNAEQALAGMAGERRIHLEAREASGMVGVTIRDNGPGITPENTGRVFDPFFTTKPVGEGTGLGLSICYGIVRQHGGRLSVESVEGEGSTFTIELPAVPNGASEPVATAGMAVSGGGE